jgi:hypothetical protein
MRNSFWIWTVLAFVVLAVGLYFQLLDALAINVDGAFLLQCAQMMLEGKIPYVGVYDNNPPLAMYLHTIPWMVCRLTNLHVVTCFVFCIFTLALGSLSWCVRILHKFAPVEDWRYLGPMLVGMSLITFTIGADYGQREHFFVLSYMPFFMLRWIRWQTLKTDSTPQLSSVESCLVGFVAGIGLCLKPHFLIPFLAAEVVWLFEKRSTKALFAPEIGGSIFAGLVYLVHFAFIPTVMKESFFGFIVPLVLNGYGAYDCQIADLLSVSLPAFYGGIFYGEPLFIPAFMSLVVFFALCLRNKCSLLLPMAAWTVGGYLTFVLQHKGWSNHTIPMLSGCFLLAGLEYGLLANFSKYNKQFLWSGLCGFFVFLFLVAAGCRNSAPLYENHDFAKDLIAHASPGENILVLACSLYPAYPLLIQLDYYPGSRYLHLFPIPMLEYWKKRSNDPGQRKNLELEEERVLTQVGKDIQANRPKLIALENSLFERGDNNLVMSRYLLQHGFIAKCMADYQLIKTDFAYKLYLRKGE